MSANPVTIDTVGQARDLYQRAHLKAVAARDLAARAVLELGPLVERFHALANETDAAAREWRRVDDAAAPVRIAGLDERVRELFNIPNCESFEIQVPRKPKGRKR